MSKFNYRAPSPAQDQAAQRAESDTNTASNISAPEEARPALPTGLAGKPRKKTMANGRPGDEPVSKESAEAAPPGEPPVSALDENHPVGSSTPTASSIPYQLGPGRLFAWFELQRELDETGGVWLAQDYSVKRQADQVALKFLPELIVSDKNAIEGLKSYLGRRITLKHPNIERVYGLVENRGRVAIQMEYLDGQSLSRLRLARPNQLFEVRDLEKWAKELCQALEYVHQGAGLIDRHLVPGNLIVNRAGNLKLKGFGLENGLPNSRGWLKEIHDSSEALPYQSPQRVAGERPTISDDLYSLGAIFYELLTGKPPFYDGDISAQVREEIPPSMTERRAELGIQGEAIPKIWEETVAACLAKDPVQRPRSAAEVEGRLKNVVSPSAIVAKSKGKSVSHFGAKLRLPAGTWLGRKPSRLIAGIIFILAIGSAIALFLFHSHTVQKPGKVVLNTIPDRPNAFLDGPAEESSLTPAVPPYPSGDARKESSLPATIPAPEVSPTPYPEVSPTPSLAVRPTSSPEVSSTPYLDASPTSSSEASPTRSLAASSTSPSEASPTPLRQEEAVAPTEARSAGLSPTPLGQGDLDAAKEEVVKRINALPGITAEKKANLIGKMNKARSMERLTVIPFESGQATLRRAAADELVKTFDTPEMRDKLSDPTIVLVVAGYADTGGHPDHNLRISQERAENISKILKEQAKLLNAIQTIGMGGTELLDSKRPEQNRAVEVWEVVPL
jgi:serine/threonine protein kinase